MDYINVRPKAE